MKIKYEVVNGNLDEIKVYNNVFKKGEIVTCYYKGLWEIESIKKQWDGKSFKEPDINDWSSDPEVVIKKVYTSNYLPIKSKRGTRRTVRGGNLGKLINTYTYQENQLNKLNDQFLKIKEIYENQLQKQATV